MSQSTDKQRAREAVQVSLIAGLHSIKPRAVWVCQSDSPAQMTHAIERTRAERGDVELAWLVHATGELVPVLPTRA